MTDEVLPGGRFANPRRSGDTILRRSTTDAAVRHRFLDHLRTSGFDLAPQPLELLPDGRERLAFIEGTAAVPPYAPEQMSDDALVNVARTARRLHDASAGFAWPDHIGRQAYDVAAPLHIDCIGHGDLSPWNIVFDGNTVKGIIDWDTCGPSSRAWDFAYTAHHFVPFHPGKDLAAWGWHEPPNRSRRLHMMVDAYGTDMLSAEDLLEHAIVRLASQGTFLAGRARVDDPLFDVQTREDHASAYFAASAFIVELRRTLRL